MAAALRFLAARWHGKVPITRLFWRDMVLTGSAVNLITTLAALAVLAAGGPAWMSVAVFVTPLPYTLFLVFAVWRTAETMGPRAGAYQAGAVLWLLFALIL